MSFERWTSGLAVERWKWRSCNLFCEVRCTEKRFCFLVFCNIYKSFHSISPNWIQLSVNEFFRLTASCLNLHPTTAVINEGLPFHVFFCNVRNFFLTEICVWLVSNILRGGGRSGAQKNSDPAIDLMMAGSSEPADKAAVFLHLWWLSSNFTGEQSGSESRWRRKLLLLCVCRVYCVICLIDQICFL